MLRLGSWSGVVMDVGVGMVRDCVFLRLCEERGFRCLRLVCITEKEKSKERKGTRDKEERRKRRYIEYAGPYAVLCRTSTLWFCAPRNQSYCLPSLIHIILLPLYYSETTQSLRSKLTLRTRSTLDAIRELPSVHSPNISLTRPNQT